MAHASPEMLEYFEQLRQGFERAYAIAQEARREGIDPESFVEVSPAADVAARVEGLVGPAGVAQRIRELAANKTRESASFEIAREIMEGKYGETPAVERIEQAVRTGLALATEGVVSAPIEGISRVELRKNPDGSEFIAVVFAGPIRGAGGTGQAIALMLADYCRQYAKISNYRPLGDEIDRAVEEINLYARRTRAGQYVPTEEEIRHIMQNCAICIDGEASEDYEVSNKRGLHVTLVEDGMEKRVAVTNRVRSGLCLVVSEGICLKAAKVLKISKKHGLEWGWIEKLIKVTKQEKQVEIKPISKYMDEIVAGRPIFSYPMRPGGLRLRYGRTRFTGIAAKAMHPASMVVLGEFTAIGTQLKIERPGKACVLTPCESIDGPVVKLLSGEVLKVESIEQARAVAPVVEEVLFLGDLLVNYGDFLKANHLLMPSGYCEEWHEQLLEQNGVHQSATQLRGISAKQALEHCRQLGVPLAPRFTFFWHDLNGEQLKQLVDWICAKGRPQYEWFELRQLMIENSVEKRLLELLCMPHRLEDKHVVVAGDYALALLSSLGILDEENKKISREKFDAAWSEQVAGGSGGRFEANEIDVMQLLNKASGMKIMCKTGLYIGSSMGRPEKAKPRKMKPPVNVLFPIGLSGGKIRSLLKAVKNAGGEGEGKLEVELANRACESCGRLSWKSKCVCGGHALAANKCFKCGKPFPAQEAKCKCGGAGSLYDKKQIDLPEELRRASEKVGYSPAELKAVIGLISASKAAEPLEKGVLRAKYDLSVFRDGTARFDATEIPLTHFTPAEVGVSVARLRELGYVKDFQGRPLEEESQVVELKPQDVIIPVEAADYFLRLAAFCDDLLTQAYGKKPFYNYRKRDDLIGGLAACLAPHTSACVLSRIVGFTQVKGILAHPFLHCATRRNCDGDELAIMLLMDVLLNFSRSYLPNSLGGKMDAPLVLTSVMNTTEIDDEAHAMDCAWQYPLEFYEATLRAASPAEVKIETIHDRLGTESQFEGIGFTHDAMLTGPTRSSYVSLGSMKQKLEIELELMRKIRAVDVAGAAERILLSHFFPDLYGNLRSFSKQSFRCVDCNAKYRRPPLAGRCRRNNCGGKLLLTINKGGIEKYLQLSKQMVEQYGLPNYMKQRLVLVEKEIKSIFEDDKVKQFSLAEYV